MALIMMYGANDQSDILSAFVPNVALNEEQDRIAIRDVKAGSFVTQALGYHVTAEQFAGWVASNENMRDYCINFSQDNVVKYFTTYLVGMQYPNYALKSVPERRNVRF